MLKTLNDLEYRLTILSEMKKNPHVDKFKHVRSIARAGLADIYKARKQIAAARISIEPFMGPRP